MLAGLFISRLNCAASLDMKPQQHIKDTIS